MTGVCQPAQCSPRPKRPAPHGTEAGRSTMSKKSTAADCAECIQTRPDDDGVGTYGMAIKQVTDGSAATGACQKMGVTVPALGDAGSLHRTGSWIGLTLAGAGELELEF